MKFIRRLLFLFLLIIVGSVVFLSFYMPTWKTDLAFIPPLRSVDFDCGEIEKEIDKYDWDKSTALAIAKAESSCNVQAKGDINKTFQKNGREYGYSVGAFQIRILPGRESCDGYNLSTNVKCAYDLYSAAKGFTDWSMYNNKVYLQYKWRTFDEFMLQFKA